jgi:HAD superfamily hydrolase (TIGR01549 family)
VSKPIKGILFDMDDTLLDWSGFPSDWATMEGRHLQHIYDYLHEQACPLNASFTDFSTEFRSRMVDAWAEGRTSLRAPYMPKILEAALVQCGFVASESLTIPNLLKAYNWRALEGVTVFPDVPEVLPKFLEKGISLGIITNAAHPMALRLAELEDLNLLQFFTKPEALISAADTGYLKPHPEVFKYGLEKLGTTAEETLYVGDNTVADIAGAQGAGMRAILRVNHPAPPLISGLIIPDAAVNNFHELLDLIERWDSEAEVYPNVEDEE